MPDCQKCHCDKIGKQLVVQPPESLETIPASHPVSPMHVFKTDYQTLTVIILYTASSDIVVLNEVVHVINRLMTSSIHCSIIMGIYKSSKHQLTVIPTCLYVDLRIL